LPLDKDNDCIKAATYLLVAAFGLVRSTPRQKIKVQF
jgi:hypothetical protein